MNFDPKDLRPEVKKAFLEARDSALKFAENFLVDPTLGTPFRATYPQKFILGSKKRDVWVCVHRRAGKCVTGDTVVINPVTLKPTPIEKASNFTTTACFDFETNQVVWSPCTWIESGKKKCLKLDLGSGSSTSLSLDHPVFCSKRGWVPASKIKIGDRILSPSIIEIYGDLDPEQNILEFDADFSIVGNKVVDNVYRYTKKSLIAFLREVFLEKGRLLHQQSCVAFMFWSRNFCLEIRHLLLRIGVDSRIDEDGNLFIEEDVDKSVFLHTIGFDHTVTEIRSPRKWEIVTSIRKLGERTVYDLSIDHDDHNFIGDNLVLHNSYSLTIASLWHAVTKPDQKIVVFAPASTQINEFFDVLDKWIVKNPFLQALQDPVGNHKNPQKRSFTNGSTIQGYLMGLAGSIEGAKRGITADVVICFPEDQRVLTDVGWVPIGEIVNNNVGTEVLSLSKDGNLEWKRITRRISNPLADRELIEIVFENGNVVCTENHPILTSLGYKEAQHLSVGDEVFYEPSIINNQTKANSYRHLIRRRILLTSNKKKQECQISSSAWTFPEGLVRVEVSRIEEPVFESSERSSESGLWQNFLRSCFNVPLRAYKSIQFILPKWKKDSNSGVTKPTRFFSFSSLVCRRWFEMQISFANKHTRIFFSGESTYCKSSANNFEWTSNCKRGQKEKTLLCRDTGPSKINVQEDDTRLSTCMHAIQSVFALFGRKSLHILSRQISAWGKTLEDSSILQCMSKPSCEFKKKELGQKEVRVYDLTIEDNHNFFAEGLLVSNCDESQLFDEEDWRVISPIMRGDKFRMGKIRSYIAGTTPDNPTNYYYEKIYKLPTADHEEKVYVPVVKNPEYSIEMVEEIKSSTPSSIWTTEWLLELGEADTAVFRKTDIAACTKWDWEYGIENIDLNKVRFIGVDWDKAQAGTNVAVFQYDPITRLIQVIYREEVSRDRFTYLNACNLILDLYDVYKPELVITDQGQGEVQWEYLQMESEKRGSELSNRLIKKAFNEKIEVLNPQTLEPEKKLLKPYLVGLLQKKVQEHAFMLPKHDEPLSNQFLGYKIVKTTANTTKYSTHNEHVVDCCLFCMYGIWYLYENDIDKKFVATNSSMAVFNDRDAQAANFERDYFWSGRQDQSPFSQIDAPRTSIENPFNSYGFGHVKDRIDRFYFD